MWMSQVRGGALLGEGTAERPAQVSHHLHSPPRSSPPSPTSWPPITSTPPPPHTMQALELIASQDQGPQSSPRGSHSRHQTQVVIGDVQMAELRQVLGGGRGGVTKSPSLTKF